MPKAITGCPIDLSSISISISDFSDCPIKKDYICKWSNLNFATLILQNRIFMKNIFIEEYQIRGMFFAIDIF